MKGLYHVLFLCTGNSARSIMAEAIMNHKGRPNFIAHSAGSHPKGAVRPEAIRQIEAAHLPANGFRSKSWDEFANPDAPKLDFVFTVCDDAAREMCPVWPGQPMTAHWGIPDPAAVTGTSEQIEKAFRDAFFLLDRRINLFLSPARQPGPAGNQARNRQDRSNMKFALRARLLAEFLGTGFLVAAVVGSGIMGERLAGGNVAIALLANTLATGAALLALILTFGPISGAHFNPVVTLAQALEDRKWKELPAYVLAQCAGGVTGAVAAHLMFKLPWYSVSTHDRSGWALLLSEFVASFGLLSVILGCSRLRPDAIPFAVASYITAAYWFTASTSFANPAVTLARCFSNTFAGIRPQDGPGFITMQLAGAVTATLVFRWIFSNSQIHQAAQTQDEAFLARGRHSGGN